MGKSSPTVAIQSKFMSSNDYFIKFHMSRLPCQFETICCRLNFWVNLKIASWQNFLVCHDIKFLVTTFSTLGGTSHPLVVIVNVSSMCYDVATTSFQRNFSCRDISLKTQCTESLSLLSNSKIFSIKEINFTQKEFKYGKECFLVFVKSLL